MQIGVRFLWGFFFSKTVLANKTPRSNYHCQHTEHHLPTTGSPAKCTPLVLRRLLVPDGEQSKSVAVAKMQSSLQPFMPVFEDTANNRCGHHTEAKEEQYQLFASHSNQHFPKKTLTGYIYSLFANAFSTSDTRMGVLSTETYRYRCTCHVSHPPVILLKPFPPTSHENKTHKRS